MSKHRIGFGLVVVSILVAFVMTRRNYVATTSAPETVTLRVGHFTIDPSFRIFMDKAGAAYTRLHPHVRIKQLDVPRQVYPQWQRTQIVGDMAPEIMQFAYFNAGVEDMVMHRFMVLDPWVEKSNPYRQGDDRTPWKETFLDGLGSRDAYSDKLRAYFGIPLIMGGYRFFYNATMRAEYHLGEAPWSYRAFRRVADDLKSAGVTDDSGRSVKPLVASDYSSYATLKMLFASVTQPLLFSLDRNYDLRVTGRDTGMGFLEGRWNYHSQELQAALHLMHEASDLMNPGFEQLRKQDGVLQFVQSRGLGMGGAHIDVTYLKELAPFKVGESAFPLPDKNDPVYGQFVLGPVTELQGTSTLTLGVLRSPLQEHALDFLQFLTGTEMMALLQEETGWRVAVKAADATQSPDLKPGYPDTLFDYMNSRGNILAYRQNAHLLFQAKGGPLQFAEKMDAESPAEILGWLSAQASTLRLTLQQQESAIMAHWVMAMDAGQSADSEENLVGFMDVNNRQEAEYLGINRFVTGREEK